MQILYIVVFMVAVFAIASAFSYRSFSGRKKETAKNRPIAESHGLKLVEAAMPPPTSMFGETKWPNAQASQIAVDPGTGDNAYYLYYVKYPKVYIKDLTEPTAYTLAVAIVTTGFWIDHSVTIEPRSSLSKNKNLHVTGDEEMDYKFKIKPGGAAATAAIITPELLQAIDNPPFPMKNWLVHFLGPQLMVKCDFVDFEERVTLLRWTQHLAGIAAHPGVPGYGTYKVQVKEVSEREVPRVKYDTGNKVNNPPVDDFQAEADQDDPDGIPSGA